METNYAHGSQEDLRIVRDSIVLQMRREYERNHSVTVGEVVREIWEDLDVAFVGMDARHQNDRIQVMKNVLNGLGINAQTPNIVKQYLAQIDNQTLQELAGRR